MTDLLAREGVIDSVASVTVGKERFVPAKRTVDGQFAVGDGVRVSIGSDCHAYTVSHITLGGKRIKIKRSSATLLNGPSSGQPDAIKFASGGFAGHCSDIQRWKIEPDPDGYEMKAYLNTRGVWRCRLGNVLAGAAEHYDYNF
jgi:hypothetical protein